MFEQGLGFFAKDMTEFFDKIKAGELTLACLGTPNLHNMPEKFAELAT